MAFGLFGRRRPGALLRSVVLASAKILYNMSLAAALRSKNAEEFNTPIGEANWKSKFTFCDLVSTAIERSQEPLSPGLFEPYFNGLVACVLVERTQLSNAACRLCGVLPKAMGAQLHSHLDRLLPALIRQSANTKTVSQKAASAAMIEMILNTPYNHRFLYHVCQTFEDKYTAPKLYAPLWLKTIIENYPLALNADRDYDTICRAISLGLEEADNNVRVNTRACFWAYQKIDPNGAEEIMNKLNAHAKTALINDPNNPDKAKSKGKKPEQDSALAQLKKERMKQKAAERRRMVSSTTVASDDFSMGAVDTMDDKSSRYPPKSAPIVAPTPEISSTVIKTASRPIAIHKKGSSHDGQIPTVTKKPSAIDFGAVSKKTGSNESLRTSQNKKPATTTETSSSRPLLSAPVRRPRIVATPINTQQPSSRPASRLGGSQTTVPTADPVLRSAVSHRELKPTPLESKMSEIKDISSKQPKKSTVVIPDGKENNYMPEYMNQAIAKRNDPASPVRLNPSPERNSGRVSPPKQIVLKSDGLSRAQRLQHQELEKEMSQMAPLMPLMAATMHQQDEDKHTQMHRAYPGLSANGNVEQARRAFEKALEYLNKDALDYMGFRKLRKLLEQFGRDLIIDRALYDLLWSHLLPRIGTFDELLPEPSTESQSEGHPRYIRQAVVTMVNILVHQYPFEWSYEYQGPAIASLMMARCAYSANAEFHEGATYVNNMSIVNQINVSISNIIEACLHPVTVLDTVLQILSAGEEFLMQNAPHDSEHQSLRSWASFNPYSKMNRTRTETAGGLFHPRPTNLEIFDVADPKPLPGKLPLLMETGLRIIKTLLFKAKHYEDKLGEEREDVLAGLARHLMSSYSIIIRKQVMEYCQVLYKNFESDDRFWSHFQSDSERNLLFYYLEKVR